MKLLKKIINLLSNHLSDDNSKNEIGNHQEEDNDSNGMTFIELEENIQEAIVKSLNAYTCSGNASKLIVKVHICDHNVFTGLGLEHNIDIFKECLKEKIKTELGVVFRSVIVTKNAPEDQSLCKSVKGKGFKNIWCLVSESATFATISVLDGFGSIADGSVRIMPDKSYNIGRGKRPQTSNGMLRVNHIAIDDNPNCKEYEYNKHVSRCHAHIGKGFNLYVDEGGTSLNNNRTRIQREGMNHFIDLNSDTKTPIPLQDGDIIELGKKVMLEFKFSD